MKRICQICAVERRWLHRHHIIPKSHGGSNDPSNLTEMCANCHEDEHGGPFGGTVSRHRKYTTGICQECHKRRWVHMHHIIPRIQGGSDHWSNLMQICANCHEDQHNGIFGSSARNTPEGKAKWRAGLAAKWEDTEFRERHLAEMREALKLVDHKAKGRKASAAWTPEKKAAHAQHISEIKQANPKPISEEQKKLLSEIKKKACAAEGYVNPNKGKTFSDETKRKMSEAKCGDRHPNWCKKRDPAIVAKIAESKQRNREAKAAAAKAIAAGGST